MFTQHRFSKISMVITAIALLLVVAGCALRAAPAASAPQPVNDETSSGQEKGAQAGGDSTGGQNDPAKQVQQKRLVIKNAALQITVDDVQTSLTSISGMASEMNGWV